MPKKQEKINAIEVYNDKHATAPAQTNILPINQDDHSLLTQEFIPSH